MRKTKLETYNELSKKKLTKKTLIEDFMCQIKISSAVHECSRYLNTIASVFDHTQDHKHLRAMQKILSVYVSEINRINKEDKIT